MTQMSLFPDLSESKAIIVPSGDQQGLWSLAGLFVILMRLPPAAGMIQMSASADGQHSEE